MRKITPRSPVLEHPRARPETGPSVGSVVVVVGRVDAVAVRDGHFTPVLRCAEFSYPITLEFIEGMRREALNNLCRWVEAGGCLRSTSAGRHRLEVHWIREAEQC